MLANRLPVPFPVAGRKGHDRISNNPSRRRAYRLRLGAHSAPSVCGQGAATGRGGWRHSTRRRPGIRARDRPTPAAPSPYGTIQKANMSVTQQANAKTTEEIVVMGPDGAVWLRSVPSDTAYQGDVD